MFDLRTVDYFLTVMARRSLRAAAQDLGVTQPALTKAIRRLEDSFGAPLFDRQARGVTPTAYGAALLRHAKDVKAALGAASEEIAALRTGSAGLVKIGAGPSWQDAVLPEAIAELRTTRPGVRVHVTGGGDDLLKEQLKSGALDFVLAAVPETPRLEPELAWQPLLADEYCIVADARHPVRNRRKVSAEDLLGYPWILPPATTYMVGRLHHLLRAAGLPAPVPAIETDVIALKFALMRGSNYLSYHAAAHLAGFNPGFIKPLNVPGTRAVRQAGLITRRGIEASPGAKALVAILERRCAKLRS
jgi:DNA-binding transcriptional LysR family regulator